MNVTSAAPSDFFREKAGGRRYCFFEEGYFEKIDDAETVFSGLFPQRELPDGAASGGYSAAFRAWRQIKPHDGRGVWLSDFRKTEFVPGTVGLPRESGESFYYPAKRNTPH